MRPLRSSLAASASRGSVVDLCASSCLTACFALPNSLHKPDHYHTTVDWHKVRMPGHRTCDLVPLSTGCSTAEWAILGI